MVGLREEGGGRRVRRRVRRTVIFHFLDRNDLTFAVRFPTL